MKSKKYIIETKKLTIEDAKNFLEKRFIFIYKRFKRKKFILVDDEALNILNKAYGKPFRIFKNIEIKFVSYKTSRVLRMHNLVVDADIFNNDSIEIRMKNNFSKFLKRFSDNRKMKIFFDIERNALFRSIFDILTHELVHYCQKVKSNGRMYSDKEDIKCKNGKIIHIDLQKKLRNMEKKGDINRESIAHYADPHEIDAYSQAVAIELIRFGTSKTLKKYKEDMMTNNIDFETKSEEKIRRQSMKKILKKSVHLFQEINKNNPFVITSFKNKNINPREILKYAK